MATLPRPTTLVTDTTSKLSLARAWQLIATIEDGLHATHGAGVLTGGRISLVSGFTVQIETATELFAEGKRHTLSATQNYNANTAEPTAYLWGVITRTSGGSGPPTVEDTYVLGMTHNTTGVAPSILHFPLAILTNSGATFSVVDNDPPGKYVRVFTMRGHRAKSVAGSSDVTFTAAEYADGILELTGLLTGNISGIFPKHAGREILVYNNTTGAFSVTLKCAGGTGFTVTQGRLIRIRVSGEDVKRAGIEFETGGTIDHGGLAGLADDDHTQYLLTSGARALTGAMSFGGFKLTSLGTPTLSGDATTKAYVDAADAEVVAARGSLGSLDARLDVILGEDGTLKSLAQALRPATDATYDLGHPDFRWQDLWLSGGLVNAKRAAATDAVLEGYVGADANPMVQIRPDRIAMGPGGASALDVFLTRTAAVGWETTRRINIAGQQFYSYGGSGDGSGLLNGYLVNNTGWGSNNALFKMISSNNVIALSFQRNTAAAGDFSTYEESARLHTGGQFELLLAGVKSTHAAGTNVASESRVSGDSVARYSRDGAGKESFGGGAGAADAFRERDGVGSLKYTGAVSVVGNLTVDGGSYLQGSSDLIIRAFTSGNTLYLGYSNTAPLVIQNSGGKTVINANGGGVGVGTASPNAASVMDVSSTTKGVLLPRMTAAQRDAIASPLAGLEVYNSTAARKSVYNGTAWADVATGFRALFDHFADESAGDAESDIYTDTLAASTLAANGDKIIANYGGNFVTLGTEAVQLQVYFDGVSIWDSTGIAVSTGTTSWRVFVEIIRVSATVIRYTVSLNTSGASGFTYAKSGELTGLTLSNTNVLKITGTSSGVGSGDGDIIGKQGSVSWYGAA